MQLAITTGAFAVALQCGSVWSILIAPMEFVAVGWGNTPFRWSMRAP
jgi:hypothetical protein